MDGVLFLLIGQKTWPEVEWGKCTAMYPCMCFSLGESQLGDGLNFLEAFSGISLLSLSRLFLDVHELVVPAVARGRVC